MGQEDALEKGLAAHSSTEQLSLFSILGGILEIICLVLFYGGMQEDDLLQDWWQNTGLLCSHPLQRVMGINKLYYSAIRAICTYQKTCGLTAIRSMAHSQTSSLP